MHTHILIRYRSFVILLCRIRIQTKENNFYAESFSLHRKILITSANKISLGNVSVVTHCRIREALFFVTLSSIMHLIASLSHHVRIGRSRIQRRRKTAVDS